MPVSKPQLPTSIWSQNAYTDPTDIIETPDFAKTSRGWLIGEKPSHMYFNYLWKRDFEMITLMDKYGIPPWDSTTNYPKGAYVIHNGALYISLVGNTDVVPINGSTWLLFTRYFEDLSDVEIQVTNEKYWDCSGTLVCTDIYSCLEYILGYNSSTSKWENLSAGTPDMPYIMSMNNLLEYQIPDDEGVFQYNSNLSSWELKKLSDIDLDLEFPVPNSLGSTAVLSSFNNKPQPKELTFDWSNVTYKPGNYNPEDGNIIKYYPSEKTLCLYNKDYTGDFSQPTETEISDIKNRIIFNDNIITKNDNVFYNSQEVHLLYNNDKLVFKKEI